MGLHVDARCFRAWPGHSQWKGNKRDEASKVTALNLEGTSGQSASYSMGKLVNIFSNDKGWSSWEQVRGVYSSMQRLYHIALW